jgi:hypothetical protein
MKTTSITVEEYFWLRAAGTATRGDGTLQRQKCGDFRCRNGDVLYPGLTVLKPGLFS